MFIFFSSFSISFKNSSHNFKNDIFLLGVSNTFGLRMGSGVSFGVGLGAFSVVASDVGSGASSVVGSAVVSSLVSGIG